MIDTPGAGDVVEANGGAPPPIGTRLELIPSHICAAVDLFDTAQAIRDGHAPQRLTIAVRG